MLMIFIFTIKRIKNKTTHKNKLTTVIFIGCDILLMLYFLNQESDDEEEEEAVSTPASSEEDSD